MRPIIAVVNSSSFARIFPEHAAEAERLGDVVRVQVKADAAPDELVARLKDADAIVASTNPVFAAQTIRALPKLKVIARHGIGCDNVDLAAAGELGIAVTKVPGELEREAVSEHCIALLLELARFTGPADRAVRAGHWSGRPQFKGIELRGRQVGIIGIGNIGSRTAEILSMGFGSKIAAYDPNLTAEQIRARYAEPAELDSLLANCDIILLHCSLNSTSRGMLDEKRLAVMRRGALLVNTARGELIDENALIRALESGQLGGYAADVVTGEPIGPEHRLLQAPRTIVVPHIAAYTEESLHAMGESVLNDLRAVLEHKSCPVNLVNREQLSAVTRWVSGQTCCGTA